MGLFLLPLRFRPGQGYTFLNTTLRTDVRSERGRAGRVGGNIGGCSAKVKEATTSLGQGYQRVANIPRWRGNRKLTLSRHTARWLGSVDARGRAASMRCPGAGASGEHESMKSRETLIRLKKFQVEERRRRVAQIEGM